MMASDYSTISTLFLLQVISLQPIPISELQSAESAIALVKLNFRWMVQSIIWLKIMAMLVCMEVLLDSTNSTGRLSSMAIRFEKMKLFSETFIVSITLNKVTMSHVNDDGYEGYPGTVLTSVTFQLTEENEFKVSFTATTTKVQRISKFAFWIWC